MGIITSRTVPIAGEKSSAEEEAEKVRDIDFPGGEADCIRAQVLSGWDDDIGWPDIVKIVHATKDTGLSLTAHICEIIFEAVDDNETGTITAAEFQDALQDPNMKELFKTLKQPALLQMLKRQRRGCNLMRKKAEINP